MDLSGGTFLGQFDAAFGGVSTATVAILLLTARVDRSLLSLGPIAQSSEFILRLSLLKKRLLFPKRLGMIIITIVFLFPATTEELT